MELERGEELKKAEICEKFHYRVRQMEMEVKRLKSGIVRLKAERDRAIKSIPHKCFTCNYAHCNSGNECDIAHYNGTSPDCLSWQWRGLEDDNV